MYSDFARGYYNTMNNNSRKEFAEFYCRIYEKYSVPSDIILDLGCGCGDITFLMAEKGFDMIGIDLSEEMLSIAKEKNNSDNIMYLCQDMRSFELYGTVGMIYSSLDCINYITDKRDLKKVFHLCYNYLDYNGIFVFDVNSLYKFENILKDNIYVYDNDKEYIVWQSSYDKKSRKCDFFIDMFYKTDGKYERFYEEQTERAYETEELKDMLLRSGFVIESIFDSTAFGKPKTDSERLFFICRKKKEE